MIWEDKKIFLQTKYLKLNSIYDYYEIKNYCSMNKDKIDKISIDNGVYITVNNIVIYGVNYVVTSILSKNIVDFCEYTEKISCYINKMEVAKCSYLKQDQNKFSKLMDNFNNINVFNYDCASKKIDFNYWKDFPIRDQETTIKTKSFIDFGDYKLGEYSFIGKVIDCKEIGITLNSLVILNLIKYALGDNDTDSIFFDLRKQGVIYSAFSKVFFDNNLLMIGCFIKYNEKNRVMIKHLIDEALVKLKNGYLFYKAKKKYINMFEIGNLEYHIGNLLEPYCRYTGKEIDLNEMKFYIENIKVKEVIQLIDCSKKKDLIIDLES